MKSVCVRLPIATAALLLQLRCQPSAPMAEPVAQPTAASAQRNDPAKQAPNAAAPVAVPTQKEAAVVASPEQLAAAKKVYQARCSFCHGPSGLGDGPMAASLRPSPRSFADAAWQQQTSDAAIVEIIAHGGAASGRSRAMPPSPDLAAQPQLMAALTQLLRSFGPAEPAAKAPR